MSAMAELLMDQVHAVMVSFGIESDDFREFQAIQDDLMAGRVVLRSEDGFTVEHQVLERDAFWGLVRAYAGGLDAFLEDGGLVVLAGL